MELNVMQLCCIDAVLIKFFHLENLELCFQELVVLGDAGYLWCVYISTNMHLSPPAGGH